MTWAPLASLAGSLPWHPPYPPGPPPSLRGASSSHRPQRITLCLNSAAALCFRKINALREHSINRIFPGPNAAASPGLAAQGTQRQQELNNESWIINQNEYSMEIDSFMSRNTNCRLVWSNYFTLNKSEHGQRMNCSCNSYFLFERYTIRGLQNARLLRAAKYKHRSNSRKQTSL